MIQKEHKEMWTVEFSESQQAFHVDTLDRILEKNLTRFYHPRGHNDWVMLMITNSHENAHKICAILKEDRKIPSLHEKMKGDC